jgi:hypothetical protein
MPKRAAEVIIVLFEVAVEIYAIGHRLNFLRLRREYRLTSRNGKNPTLRPSKDHSTKRERSRTRLQLVFTATPVLDDQLLCDGG